MKNQFDWQSEWVGMPEFIQESQKPYAAINFRFKSQEDLDSFAKLIGQRLTNKTKSAWFPEIEKRQRGLWVDDES